MPSSELYEELNELADRLKAMSERCDKPEIVDPAERLVEAANRIGKSWSGSSLGYHARTYYKDFEPVPGWANFSGEWGLYQYGDTTGAWVQHDPKEVEKLIYETAGNPNLAPLKEIAKEARELFERSKLDVLSIITTFIPATGDEFLAKIKEDAEGMSLRTKNEILSDTTPKGAGWSRDTLAVTQGMQPAPHLSVSCEVLALRQPSLACSILDRLARKAGSHMARQQIRSGGKKKSGTKIFIGHGGSPLYLRLEKYLTEDLKLEVMEYGSISTVGLGRKERLQQLLDGAGFAILVMTAEDEHSDGELHARENVIHEAGLFQGKLGFTRAIILKEEGCKEFSNIDGLGQVRFPKGNIEAGFHGVKKHLEQEKII